MAYDSTLAPGGVVIDEGFEPASDTPLDDAAPFEPASDRPIDAHVDWIKQLEGWNPQAYGDFKQLSIGYGTRARGQGEVIDETEGERRLREELADHERRIDTAAQEFGYALTPGQRDALISFDFNTGAGRTLLQTSEGDLDRVAERMGRYINAGGQPRDGLRNRRAKELERFRGVEPAAPAEPFEPSSEVPVDVSPGFLDRISNAVERGFRQSQQAEAMEPGTTRASTVVATQRLMDDLPQSPELQAFNAAPTFEDAVKRFAESPLDITAELVAESMGSFLPTLARKAPARVAVGTAIGAGAGSVIPGIGTAAGAVTGARAGFIEATYASSLALETSGKILDTLRENGVDVRDDKALGAVFSDPQRMTGLRELALKKGVPIAVFDAFSAGIGGRLFTKSARTLIGKAGHGAAELGMQAGLGMGGELAGELTAGEQISPAAILGEGIGELGPGSVEIAAGLATRPAAPVTAETFEPASDVPIDVPAEEGADPFATPPAASPPATTPPTAAAPPAAEAAAPESARANISTDRAWPVMDDAARQRLVREHSFPRGLVEHVTPENAALIFAEKPGTRAAISVVQSAMRDAEAAAKSAVRPSESARTDAADPDWSVAETPPEDDGEVREEMPQDDAAALDQAAKSARRELDSIRSARQTAEITLDEDDSRDPEEEGRLWFTTWQAPKRDKWMQEFVEEPIITEADGKFYVGESRVAYNSLEDAFAAAKEAIQESIKDQRGTFDSDMDGQEITRAVFEAWPAEIKGVENHGWFNTKWGSWYLEGRFLDANGDPDYGHAYKLSIRDHDVSRTDMGRVDKAFHVSKRWEPEEVAEALKRALAWLKQNATAAGPAASPPENKQGLSATALGGGAGFKTPLGASEPAPPTQQGDIRLADRATAATSEPVRGDIQRPPGPAVNEQIESYLDAEGVTDPARRGQALADLANLTRTLSAPALTFRYEITPPTQAAPAGERRPGTAAERSRAETLKRAVGGLGTEEAGAVFAEGDTVSSLIASALGRQTGFDVRGARVETARDAAALMLPLRTPWFESLKLLVLDARNVVTHSEILNIGTLSSSDVDVQRIIATVDRLAAGRSVVLSHNHPSGDVTPSEPDRRVTEELRRQLGEAGIEFRDMIITDGWGFMSMAEGRAEAFPETHVADWEAVPRHELPPVLTPEARTQLAATLRGGDPDAIHVAYLSTRKTLVALQRLPATITGPQLAERVRRQAAAEGAMHVLISVPDAAGLRTAEELATAWRGKPQLPKLLDVHAPGVPSLAAANWNRTEAAPPKVAEVAVPQTETPAFKQWFGKSKVVDANGRPLVVYHGTEAAFTEYDPLTAGRNLDSGYLGTGFYFTSNPETASYYSGTGAARNPNIQPVFLSLQNPFLWGRKGGGVRMLVYRNERLPDAIHDAVIKRTGWKFDPAALDGDPEALALDERMLSEAIRAELHSRGFDGVIAEVRNQKEIVAFWPEQIKSATGNAGTFNPNNPSIVAEGEEDSALRLHEEAPIDGTTAQKRREHVETVKRMTEVAPTIKETLDALYQPATSAETRAKANARINELGLEEAERVFRNATNGDHDTMALGHYLALRLQENGLHARATEVRAKMAAMLTDHARALWFISTIAKTSPEGIQRYAEKIIAEALAEGGFDAHYTEALAEIARLEEELAKLHARKDQHGTGTKAILEIQDLLRAMKLTPERLAELNNRLREALIQSIDAPGTARDRIVGLLIAAGMDRKKAIPLAEKAMKAFAREARKARDARLRELLKQKPDRPAKARGALEKVIALNQAGALDDASLHGAVAKALGIPVFTAEHAARIKAMQAEYEAAKDAQVKLALGMDLLDYVHSLVPATLGAKAKTVQVLSMLLGRPVVALRNILGNTFMFAANIAADGVNAYAIDPATSFVRRQAGQNAPRTAGSAAVAEKIAGLAQPWRDWQAGIAHARDMGRAGTWRDGLEMMLKLAKLTSRGVWDVSDLRRGQASVFTSATMQLLEKGLTLQQGVADRAFYMAALRGSLERQMAAARADGLALIGPTPAMLAEAQLDANKATFQDENAVSATLKGIERLLNGPRRTPSGSFVFDRQYGIGSAVVAFAKVPGAIALRGVEFSPLGFINSAVEIARPIVRGQPFRQRQFTASLSKALVGSGVVVGTAYWLAAIGVMTSLPEDDPDLEEMRKASGWGKYRINVSALIRAVLGGPAAWFTKQESQHGDMIVSYDWAQPLAIPMAMGAEARLAQERAQREGGSALSTAARATLGGVQTLESLPMLAGLSRLAETFANSRRSGGGYGETIAVTAAGMPGNFVPGLVQDVNKLLDPQVRETRAGSLIERQVAQVLARIPGAAQQFPPRYDIFGQAIQKYQYGGNSVVTIFLSKAFHTYMNPAFTTRFRDDSTLREVAAIVTATGDKGALPPSVGRTLTVNGTKLELTNEQRSQYQRYVGAVAMGAIAELAASPAFARAPEAVRAHYYAEIIRNTNTAAKIELFGERMQREPSLPGFGPAGTRNQILRGRSMLLDQPAGVR